MNQILRRYLVLSLFMAATLPSLHAQLVLTPSANAVGGLVDTSYGYNLSENFHVNSDIQVLSVGYWDHGQDGVLLGATIQVGIFDRGSGLLVAGTEVDFTGTTGSLVGGTVTNSGTGQFRVAALSGPVTLTAGNDYAIVAFGFGNSNAYINGLTSGPAADFDDMGGALTFLSAGYDDGSPGSLAVPSNNTSITEARWLAGTFTAVPEPSTYAMFAGLGALGLAMIRRRLAASKPGRV